MFNKFLTINVNIPRALINKTVERLEQQKADLIESLEEPNADIKEIDDSIETIKKDLADCVRPLYEFAFSFGTELEVVNIPTNSYFLMMRDVYKDKDINLILENISNTNSKSQDMLNEIFSDKELLLTNRESKVLEELMESKTYQKWKESFDSFYKKYIGLSFLELDT